MADVSRDDLWKALSQHCGMNASGRVLRGDKLDLTPRPLIPPVLQAAYQLEGDGGSDGLSIKDFEDLSRAARVALFSPSPAREAAFPTIDAADLINVLSEAAAFASQELSIGDATPGLGDDPAAGDSAFTAAARIQQGLRGGLQLIGFRILGNDGLGARDSEYMLRLTNARLPFSVRLIGCVVESPLLFNNCELVTLDLSGSAICGLDATFLQAKGSVRLRRTASRGAMDFAGARISGYFDATDCAVQTLDRSKAARAFSADRGVLNLSQSTVENEMYLNRARIWGGLTLKGAVVNRSIFMDDAVIRSPVAVLEKLIADLVLSVRHGRGPTPATLFNDIAAARDQEEALVAATICPDEGDAADLRQRIDDELIVGSTRDHALKGSPLHQLLSESMRARTSAIRADGLRVNGSIFARALGSNGRARFKYARIAGGLHLEGARLRSMYACQTSLHYLKLMAERDAGSAHADIARELFQFLEKTELRAEWAERSEKDDLALDIRDVAIEGNLKLSERIAAENGETRPLPTSIDGVLDGGRIKVQGKVDLSDVQFRWSTLSEREDLDQTFREGRKYQVVLSNAVVGDDVVLKRSAGLRGINLEMASVQGCVSLSDEITPKPPVSDQVSLPDVEFRPQVLCCNQARLVSGRINLSNARIAQDVFLIFTPAAGPEIRAVMARISGRLDIYSQCHAKVDTLDFDHSDYENSNIKAKNRRNALEADAGRMTAEEWAARPRPPTIDLTDARATTFTHVEMAWPEQDGLKLTGFSYDRSTDYGPLAPYPFVDNTNSAGWAMCLWGSLLSLVGALVLGSVICKSFLPPPSQDMSWPLLEEVGPWNLFILALLFLGVGVQVLSTQLSGPRLNRAKPTATKYLARQVSSRNRYRRARHLFVGLDAYARAAKALRDEGRPISANFVERERVKIRSDMLSWRHHFLGKLGLKALGFIADYGFDIPRLMLIAAVLALSTAMLADYAKHEGLLVYRNEKPQVTFSSLIYSADVIVPLIDLKLQDDWGVIDKTNVPPVGAKATAAKAPAAARPKPTGEGRPQSLWAVAGDLAAWFMERTPPANVIVAILLWAAEILGWVLTSMIAVSLAIRTQTLIGRSEV